MGNKASRNKAVTKKQQAPSDDRERTFMSPGEAEELRRILLQNITKVTRGPGADVEIGISWDLIKGLPEVDFDVTAVLFDGTGQIVDACYYQQQEIANGAIKHSGDNRSGEGQGDDEIITVDLDALDPCIQVICFVANAYSGGSFESVE